MSNSGTKKEVKRAGVKRTSKVVVRSQVVFAGSSQAGYSQAGYPQPLRYSLITERGWDALRNRFSMWEGMNRSRGGGKRET